MAVATFAKEVEIDLQGNNFNIYLLWWWNFGISRPLIKHSGNFLIFLKKKKKTVKRPKRAENGKKEIYSLNLQCETVLINTTIECLNQPKWRLNKLTTNTL